MMYTGELIKIFQAFDAYDRRTYDPHTERLERFSDYITYQRSVYETLAQLAAQRLGTAVEPVQCLEVASAAKINQSIGYYFKLNKTNPAPDSGRKEIQ